MANEKSRKAEKTNEKEKAEEKAKENENAKVLKMKKGSKPKAPKPKYNMGQNS